MSKDLKDENKVVIWLSYFIAESRSKGRRVRKLPFKLSLEMVMNAAQELNLEPQVLETKTYPRDKRTGAIIVKKAKSKNYTINLILSKLLEKTKVTSNK
ncbi:MAG: signal recognition particle protein Srp19 [Sulfolobus sp.]|nr:signal recognition particle protein Srp19 [Sulfolobus sp.]